LVKVNGLHCFYPHSAGKSALSWSRASERCEHAIYPVESLQESLAEGIVTGHKSVEN
jgi:hypothetical protein